MLLRRVIEHVKAQNWTAVALDFVIVVVGVFIGIQVSNWNDARKDRRLEAAYLARLAADLETDAGLLAEAIAEAEAYEAAAAFAFDASEDPQLAATNPCRFVTSLIDAQRSYYPILNRQTYDELISTGGLSLIQDDDPKAMLGAYYAQHESGDQYSEQFRDLALRYGDIFRRAIPPALRKPLEDAADDDCPVSPAQGLEARERFVAVEEAAPWLLTLRARQQGFASRLTASLERNRQAADAIARSIDGKADDPPPRH